MYRWAALSDHWAAATLRRVRSAFLQFSVPVPHPLAKLTLTVYLAGRTVVKFFVRVLLCQPGFRAYCSSYGKGLVTSTHLPWVHGKGRIVAGDHVRIYGRISIMFAVRYSAEPTLEIGDRSTIGHNSTFVIGRRITIGNDCLIANDVIARGREQPAAANDNRLLARGRGERRSRLRREHRGQRDYQRSDVDRAANDV